MTTNLITIQTQNDITTAEGISEAVEIIKRGKSDFNLGLAQVLYEVREKQHYLNWPTGRFGTFDEWGKVVMERGKSCLYGIVRVYEVFCLKHGVDPARLRAIGWGKLCIISSCVTDANLEGLLRDCETLSLFEIQKIVKRLTKGDDKADSGGNVKKISFEIMDDQLETINSAMEIAGELADSQNDAKRLEYICADFLCGSSLDSSASHLDRLVMAMENAFNVTVTVTPREGSVVDSTAREPVETEEPEYQDVE